MKYLLISCLLFSLYSLNGQKTEMNCFYYRYKQYQGVTSISLPGWLVKSAVGISKPFLQEKEHRLALQMLGKLGRIRILTSESLSIKDKHEDQLRGYEILFYVKSDNKDVYVWMHEHKKRAKKKLVILVNQPESFFYLDLKAKLKPEQLEAWMDTMQNIN